MLLMIITALVTVVSGLVAWLIAVRRHGDGTLAPSVEAADIRNELRRHPTLAAAARSAPGLATPTGMALSFACVVLAASAAGFGLVLVMVRTHGGFARLDLGAARFGARHASGLSTHVLRVLTQLGGAVVLAPLAAVVWLVERRHRRAWPLAGFLTVTVGGQFLLVDVIKWIVGRARPNIHRLTGFSGASFPSGHAAAAAATFAAFAVIMGQGHSRRVKAVLAGVAVGLASSIACTRVFLGVHWLTDVLAGLALGWAWIAVSSIAFGARVLHFGTPAAQATGAADARQP